MDATLVDVKKLKTLEDLAIFLSAGIISMNTMRNMQVRAIEIGIMKEDMNERANVIFWELERCMKLYTQQLEAVLELLPDDFDPNVVVNKMMKTKVRNKK